MAYTNRIHIKSKYKHVRGHFKNGYTSWSVSIAGVSTVEFKTEREAAIAADTYLIKKNKEPVNILVKKQYYICNARSEHHSFQLEKGLSGNSDRPFFMSINT